MEYLIVGALIIAVFLYSKVKNFFYKAKDNALVKEDQTLHSKQQSIEKQIQETKEKLKEPTTQLTPEQIEEYWRNKK